MNIKLYNTRTKQKEEFSPLDPANVRMYVCGPTVYDRAHIGNARPVVVFDLLFRLLRYIYSADRLTYARNLTDVDDKINTKALETGRSIADITSETIDWFHQDMQSLGVLAPTHEPRATQYIPQMIRMIETLITHGHAYEVEGHVLFDVSSDVNYGTLSRRSLDEMQAGARVEVAPYKRNATDFVLWKPSVSGDLPGWDSPWGRGRPGWHIECSAMANDLLGESFDIHGGGIDLCFPHHENEYAQSRCANPAGDFANIWMHNGFLKVDGEKMSKSLGNFRTVRDVLDQGYDGQVIRLALLSSHYRQPLDWTTERLEEMRKSIDKWIDATKETECMTTDVIDEKFLNAVCDDLNTPLAFARMHELADGTSKDKQQLKSILNLLQINVEAKKSVVVENIISLIQQARRNKDYAISDVLRDTLINAGVDIHISRQDISYTLKPSFDESALEK